MGIWKLKLKYTVSVKVTEKIARTITKRRYKDFYSSKSLGFILVTWLLSSFEDVKI